MGSILKTIDLILGRSHLERTLVDSEKVRVLHISDTPSSIYPEIKRIIKIIKPHYIIHTGDIADNIKLELYPSYIDRFKHESRKILRILNNSSSAKIFLCLGNHDHPGITKKHSGRIEIIEDRKVIEIEGKRLAVSHYSDRLKDLKADMYLFGHDLSIESQVIRGKICLNGIEAMHLIDLESLHVEKIGYPVGTNRERLTSKRTRL